MRRKSRYGKRRPLRRGNTRRRRNVRRSRGVRTPRPGKIGFRL